MNILDYKNNIIANVIDGVNILSDIFSGIDNNIKMNTWGKFSLIVIFFMSYRLLYNGQMFIYSILLQHFDMTLPYGIYTAINILVILFALGYKSWFIKK